MRQGARPSPRAGKACARPRGRVACRAASTSMLDASADDVAESVCAPAFVSFDNNNGDGTTKLNVKVRPSRGARALGKALSAGTALSALMAAFMGAHISLAATCVLGMLSTVLGPAHACAHFRWVDVWLHRRGMLVSLNGCTDAAA